MQVHGHPDVQALPAKPKQVEEERVRIGNPENDAPMRRQPMRQRSQAVEGGIRDKRGLFNDDCIEFGSRSSQADLCA
ncbi:hypothetical protein JCM16408A_46770 [Methylobacterium phyllosphaerae]